MRKGEPREAPPNVFRNVSDIGAGRPSGSGTGRSARFD